MGSSQAGTTRDGSLHRLVVEASPDLQVVSTVDGVFRFASPASRSLFGWEPHRLVGSRRDDFIHPDDLVVADGAADGATGDVGGTVTSVCRFRCGNGTYRWTETASNLVHVDGELLVVSVIRDIGDRKQSELDLQRLASTDPLTGVANRTVFRDRLQHALRRLDRHEGLVAVLFLDLDRFKVVNDSLGHLVGDAVLLEMAQRLSGFLRPQDTLARLGGDEFAVIVEDMALAEDVVALGMRIIEAGHVPFVVGDEQFTCTTSVGIAVTADAARSADGLLQEADLALYRAKDRGRDRAEVFDEDLRARTVDRLATERMLRQAADQDRLRLCYQPVVDLRTGRTVAAEALVRVWDPSESRLVAAGSFIDVAEESGLLAAIDEWVMAQALEQVAEWHLELVGTEFGDVAINVTARHLADPAFARSVIDELSARGLPTSALQIDVTEHALMAVSTSAIAGLASLRDAGVKVGLDDFGTGYSSVSHLQLFPLDVVKIDRSFVAGVADGAQEAAVVGSIISLAHALGMEVVAEGVETTAQLDLLAAMGCDRAQGFAIAAPGPPAVISELVLRADPRPGPAVAQPH